MEDRHVANHYYKKLNAWRQDSPDQVAERIKRSAAGKQANEEMMIRFGPLDPNDPEKIYEAMRWQDERIKELMEAP